MPEPAKWMFDAAYEIFDWRIDKPDPMVSQDIAEVIAKHAPANAYPALKAEVERLRKALEGLKDRYCFQGGNDNQLTGCVCYACLIQARIDAALKEGP